MTAAFLYYIEGLTAYYNGVNEVNGVNELSHLSVELLLNKFQAEYESHAVF